MSHEEPQLRRVGEVTWELPQTGAMRVPGRVFADETLVELLARDKTLVQLRNVCHMPGILRRACDDK